MCIDGILKSQFHCFISFRSKAELIENGRNLLYPTSFLVSFSIVKSFGLVLTSGDASRTRRVNFRSKKSSYAAPQNRQNNILIEKKN